MTMDTIPVGIGLGLYSLASFWAVQGLLRPSGLRRKAVAISLALGSSVFIGVLLWRGLHAGRIPVFGRFEALTVYSLVVTAAFFVAAMRARMRGLAALLVPYITLLLFCGATAMHQPIPADPAMDSLWLGLHVFAAFIGYALCTLAGALGLAYVIQDNNLKNKRLGVLFERLPALETLDHVMATLIGAAFIMLTLSVAFGAQLVHLSGGGAEWLRDPKVLSTLVTWGIYAVLMHMRTNADRHGKGMAVIAMVGLLFVLFSFLGIHVVADSVHSFIAAGGASSP
jgi:ABC-type transport system involved in cytochrome c biogenesis permease subunit